MTASEENSDLFKDCCPRCKFKVCQCKEIAAEAARQKIIDANIAAKAAREAAERQKQADIIRLGGQKAYDDFTAEKYTNKNLLKVLSGYPEESYYLWGKTGVGKTHGATATIRLFPEASVVTLAAITREIRAAEKPKDEQKIIEKYATGKYVFDDILTEKVTEFLKQVLYEIVNRRWLNKATGAIFTANMDITSLAAAVGNKIASRIVGITGPSNVIELEGFDHRIYTGELFAKKDIECTKK